MSKPRSIAVDQGDQEQNNTQQRQRSTQPEPLSGSKKTKQKNHTSHNNPQG
ncbi:MULTISPECIES: small acid-soluble spore protein P [unclassified Paenibacillus]|uniref:small acid-soluble spore protein P n=1 Tax=unclassified Paenibacillus TaxID=185978 RepID=UPI002F3E6827